jgi:hypothetical protein
MSSNNLLYKSFSKSAERSEKHWIKLKITE